MFKRDLKENRESVNIVIDRFLPRKDEYPKKIHKAMRHTLFAGGKRIRPYLMVKTHNLFAKPNKKIVELAAAVELIHTYTLIHDDLPEIDNDDMRRGKPTCHVLYGSDMALLSGDALLVNAFELASMVSINKRLLRSIVKEIAKTCGAQGLIGGQMADILNEGKQADEKTLEYIHYNKTVKLFQLCSRIGCMVGKARRVDRERFEEYSYCIGMAFQIVDDILDIEGEEELLGKTIGKDERNKKLTYPAVYGLEKSKKDVELLMKRADELLSPYKDNAFYLRLLNNYIVTRKI